jgi:hypothetical protein
VNAISSKRNPPREPVDGYRPVDSIKFGGLSLSGDDRPVGLVAGWGRFPVLVAESLVAARRPIVCVALKGLADPSLEYLCDHVRWLSVAKLGAHLRYFKRHRVQSVTMAGKLFKADLLFQRSVILSHWPDWESLRTFGPLLFRRKRDTRDDSLLMSVTNTYLRKAMKVVPPTDFAPELLVPEGFVNKRKPTASQARDIAFGWAIAKTMGGMDIGQSITVRDGTVIAVEAVEGTDACIQRSGELCRRGGWTLIKVAKPKQDMRFDVPTIGPLTVKMVAAAGGTAIAIEADRTIVVDVAETARLADSLGVAIVAMPDEEAKQQEHLLDRAA